VTDRKKKTKQNKNNLIIDFLSLLSLKTDPGVFMGYEIGAQPHFDKKSPERQQGKATATRKIAFVVYRALAL
jgi:hypothetical protein